MGGFLSSLLRRFHQKRLEVVLVGLNNSGKTTLLNVLSMGEPAETCPTIGLNVKTVKRGSLTMKCWDIGGQAAYRSEWGRYARGCDVILFILDAHDGARAVEAKKELHRLLEDRELSTTPILVLANKIDLQPHLSETEVIQELNLDYIVDNPWLVMPVSALRSINIERVLEWLIARGK